MKRYIAIIAMSVGLIILAGCESLPGTVVATPSSTAMPSMTPQIGVSFVTITPPKPQTPIATPIDEVTPLPSLTPTPFVYIVESGDTLAGIALTHNIPLQDLMALNPEVLPELLQVGQQLILPQAAPTPNISVTSDSVSLELDVVGLGYYPSPGAKGWVLGEVWNRSHNPVRNVQVEIAMVDDNGFSSSSTLVWVAPGIIQPDNKAPFGAIIDEPMNGNFTPMVSVIGEQGVSELGNHYLDLAVTDTGVNIDQGQVSFSGQVQNIGDKTANHVSLVTTFYNDEALVTGFHEWSFPDQLAPGESVPFLLQAIPPVPGTIDYRFRVQSLIAEP